MNSTKLLAIFSPVVLFAVTTAGVAMAELPPILDVWNFSDPEATRATFGELAERAGREGDEVYQAEALTQIARCHSLQGKFDMAHAVLDGMRTMPGAKHPRVQARIALERGRSLNSAGDKQAAVRQFVTAWEISHANGEDYLAVDAAHMVAIASDLAEAETWTQKGREAALASPDKKVLHWLGPLHNNLGWSFFFAERYEDALSQFELSKSAYRDEGDEGSALIADYSIGKTNRLMGHHQEAVAIQEGIKQVQDARGEEDGYVLEELAESYSALGRKEESRVAAARALELLSPDAYIAEHEPERLERLKALAR